uniref:Uncharacterized protein n=1 Tax=Arion vulgaris TaxID=1028688 RepID=A0A0B6ZHF1_9EUPU
MLIRCSGYKANCHLFKRGATEITEVVKSTICEAHTKVSFRNLSVSRRCEAKQNLRKGEIKR